MNLSILNIANRLRYCMCWPTTHNPLLVETTCCVPAEARPKFRSI